jgi:hypothetical protein
LKSSQRKNYEISRTIEGIRKKRLVEGITYVEFIYKCNKVVVKQQCATITYDYKWVFVVQLGKV